MSVAELRFVTPIVNVTTSPPTTPVGLLFDFTIAGLGWRTLTVYVAVTGAIGVPPRRSLLVKRAVLVRSCALTPVPSAAAVTRTVRVTRKRCGDAVVLS